MTKKVMLVFILSFLFPGQGTQAAELQLQLSLPDVTLLQPPASPPQLQKEGLPLAGERATVEELFTYMGKQMYEDALDYLRTKEKSALMLVENGDPEGELKSRAVVGGLMPTNRSSQISATLLYLIGHVYFVLENYPAAETAFIAALQPLPDYIRVHESLGLLYLSTERFEESQGHLARAAELGLHTANLFAALGYVNFEMGNLWGAASAYQEALALKPGVEEWEKGLLYTLLQSSQHETALALVEQLLQKHPDDESLWLYRGQAAMMGGNDTVALTSLETAIRLGNDSVANLQIAATLHLKTGSMQRAVNLLKAGFDQGLDFDYMDQGMSWLQQQDEWDYLETMLAAIRQYWDELDGPQRSKVLVREADMDIHDGDDDAAREALQQAIDMNPSNASALMSLASIYHNIGNYNRAEILYQRAGAYDAFRENALVSLAQLAIDQDDFSRALEFLRGVQREFPGRSDLDPNIQTLENLVRLQSEN